MKLLPMIVMVAVVSVLATSVMSQRGYRSVVRQSIHYFARPHENLPSEHRFLPIQSPAAWIGGGLDEASWTYVLSKTDIETLEAAVIHFEHSGVTLDALDVRSDFPISYAATKLFSEWRRQLSADGRGFQRIRGVPVDEWTERQSEIFFWAFGQLLGIAGAQDNTGELLGHVRDVGASAKTARQYLTNGRIDFHCDAADVVGLLCLKTAKTGGLSRIISSVSVYNRLLQRPDGQTHVRRLFSPVWLDSRGTGGVNFVSTHPLRRDDDGVLRTFWHTEYFRSYERHPKAPPMDDATTAALDAYDSVTATDSDLWLDMELRRGDIQLVSNHFLLHSRTAYEDHAEVENKRHLLRLWISLEEGKQSVWSWAKVIATGRVVYAFAWAKIFS